VDLYRRLLTAPPEREELLLATSEAKFPLDVSFDGRLLLYESIEARNGLDLWALPLDGERRPIGVVRTEYNEAMAQFSPDGKWLAYQSDKTGKNEIYLRPFPSQGPDTSVSTSGGTSVRWNANGRELFYLTDDERLVAIPVTFSSDGRSAEPGTPVPLFTLDLGSSASRRFRPPYVVSEDGKSFVMQAIVGKPSVSPVTVILNWAPPR
jgi:eukaryotic-like serine/threonine-protein kinase